MGTASAEVSPLSSYAVSTTSLASAITFDSRLIGALVLCVALVALGVFVLLHNTRALVNRRFGLMALTTAGWVLTISLALAAKDIRNTLFLGRLGFAFASAIPFTMIWMVESVAISTARRHFLRVAIPAALCSCFVLASTSTLIVADAIPGTPRANFVYGPAHPFFGLYFLVCFAFGLYNLWQTIRSSSGLERLQLRYLLLGISLTGAGAMTTNLAIPVLWSTSHYSFLGPYFSLLFFSFSAHAIIRHRLLDMRVVIRRGVVYTLALAATGSAFLLLADLLKRFSTYDKDRISLAEGLVVALVLAILFQPIKQWIQVSLNRYLYRETYNYQRTIRDASHQLATMLDVDSLLNYLARTISVTFNSQSVALYLRDPLLRGFSHRSTLAQHHRPRTTTPTISDSSPLASLLKTNRRAVVREEAARQAEDRHAVGAAKQLTDLAGDIAFPLTHESETAAILIVGPKLSGDPYFADDIALLDALLSQAAVSIKNAQLYQQVVRVNEYVDNILSTMHSGVIAVDELGNVSLFNHAAERLTGFSAHTVQGTSYRHLPSALTLPLANLLETHAPTSEFEARIEHSSGPRIPVVCSTALLTNKEGTIHGGLIVFSDLTRLKDLEREKQRAERLASLGAFASGIAHEIKNPLVAIRTFAELLPERFAETDFREDFSKVVIAEIARIDDLVGRLRGIAATAPKHLGTVDIREPITHTLMLLRGQLERNGTTVRCEFDDTSPQVAVAESQLKQLFLNIILNSLEALGAGGEILVRVYRRQLHGTASIVTEISDTGPGIPDAIRSSIFDPFFTTKARGSGLGLAICRGITDAHRGAIRAENRIDRRGTSIVVEFPLSIGSPVLSEQPAFSTGT